MQRLLLAPLLFLGACASTGDEAIVQNFAGADAEAQAEMPSPEEQARIAAEMAELAQPGPEHERLAAMAGSWDLEQRMYMPGNDTPMVLTGRSESEMVLGGRFLEMRTRVAGLSESIGYLGFDRRHGVFTTVGFDTLGTYWVSGRGPYDPERGALVLYGEDEDPTAGVNQKFEFVIAQPSPDQLRVEVVFLPGSFGNTEPWKAVELIQTRRTDG
jgi:hypothetical protein